MTKQDIIKAYQIPNRITMGIFNLPCVTEVIKSKYYGGFFYGIDGYFDINGAHKVMRKDGSVMYQAYKGDWLCYCNDGNWYVLTDKEYKDYDSNA